MSLQAAGGSVQSHPLLLLLSPPTSPLTPMPPPVLVRGVTPDQPHKWFVDLTRGRLRPLLALARRLGRAGAVSAAARPHLGSHVA